MRNFRLWIAIGGVLTGAALLLLLSPRAGAFAVIGLTLAALALIAYRTL